jgi:hypothetical protein
MYSGVFVKRLVYQSSSSATPLLTVKGLGLKYLSVYFPRVGDTFTHEKITYLVQAVDHNWDTDTFTVTLGDL